MGSSKDWPSSITDCSSPRRIVSRWISGLRRCRVKSAKDDKELGDLTLRASCSINGLNESKTGRSSMNAGCFNAGVGLCLLYLIAASKNELDNVIDTRMQMEALLNNARRELLKEEDELCKVAEPECNDLLVDDSAAPNVPGYETPILAESSRVTVCNQSLKWETPEKDERMDEVEAELECLQLHLDKEELLKHTKQVTVTDEQSASSKSQTINIGKMVDPRAEETGTEYGVSPDDLERRLHELLEARQQERIRELEAALDCIRLKLHEKETEVRWWKDTASMVSRHVIISSEFTSEHDPKIMTPQIPDEE